MKIAKTVHELRTFRKEINPSKSVGFVPTMGGLHGGHMSLVQKARSENDIVIVSVFVNPTQFAPHEDLETYPRSYESDIQQLEQAKVDCVFTPVREEMYSSSHRIYCDPKGFDDISEGLIRPGFFRGVATVVCKLFNIVQPTHAYFGQKDAVQCVVIRRLIEDLNFPIKLTIGETCREDDGLALSTRNQYLSKEERQAAPILYQALAKAKAFYLSHEASEIKSEDIRSIVRGLYGQEALIKEVQYVSLGSTYTMEELEYVNKKMGAILSVGVRLGNCRLIDNMVLPPQQ